MHDRIALIIHCRVDEGLMDRTVLPYRMDRSE